MCVVCLLLGVGGAESKSRIGRTLSILPGSQSSSTPWCYWAGHQRHSGTSFDRRTYLKLLPAPNSIDNCNFLTTSLLSCHKELHPKSITNYQTLKISSIINVVHWCYFHYNVYRLLVIKKSGRKPLMKPHKLAQLLILGTIHFVTHKGPRSLSLFCAKWNQNTKFSTSPVIYCLIPPCGKSISATISVQKISPICHKRDISVRMLSEDMENSKTCKFCLNSQYMCPDGWRLGTHQIWVQKVDGIWQLSTVNDFDIDLIQKNTTISLTEDLIPCFWYSETWAMLQWLFTEQRYTYMCEDHVPLFEHRPNTLFLAQNELKIAE